MPGKKIELFFIEDGENSPYTIDIAGWSGKAIVCRYESIERVTKRSELNTPGTYILKTRIDSGYFEYSYYVGESECVVARLKQHLRSRETEFEELISFSTKDDSLTKAHIRYLESRIIQEARLVEPSIIENKSIPALPTLTEADVSVMEDFLSNIRTILSITKYELLNNRVGIGGSSTQTNGSEQSPLYHIKNRLIQASMYKSEKGFVVLRGSMSSRSEGAGLGESRRKLRAYLIESNFLVDKGDHLEFTVDYTFRSPSEAASVVTGTQTPGPIRWITESGETFKQVQQSILK